MIGEQVAKRVRVHKHIGEHRTKATTRIQRMSAVNPELNRNGVVLSWEIAAQSYGRRETLRRNVVEVHRE